MYLCHQDQIYHVQLLSGVRMHFCGRILYTRVKLSLYAILQNKEYLNFYTIRIDDSMKLFTTLFL